MEKENVKIISPLTSLFRECKRIIIGLICLLPLGFSGVQADDTFFQNIRIGILKIDSQELETAERESIEAAIEAGMQGSVHFILVERRKLARLLEESELQQAGVTCNGDDCSAQQITLQQADKIITPSVERMGSWYVLVLRCVDVKTGKIDFIQKSDRFPFSELFNWAKIYGGKAKRAIDERIAPPYVRQDLYLQLEGGYAMPVQMQNRFNPAGQIRLEVGYPLAFGYLALGGYYNTWGVVKHVSENIREIKYSHFGGDVGVQFAYPVKWFYMYLQPFVGFSQHQLQTSAIETIIQATEYDEKKVFSNYAYTGGVFGFGIQPVLLSARYQHFFAGERSISFLTYSVVFRYYFGLY